MANPLNPFADSLRLVTGDVIQTIGVPKPKPTPRVLIQPRMVPAFNNMARLATIPSKGFTLDDDSAGKVTIWLPHLPEDIPLKRDNSYMDTGANMVMPDGLWIYSHTSPLEIGLAFSLHAYDELCVEGPKSLLSIAANLHSLVLPSSNDPLSQKASVPATSVNPLKATSLDARYTGAQNANSVNTVNTLINQGRFSYPPACSLRLIQAGQKGLGINCVGFVKNVDVTLHGPYLQTSRGSESFNLPSAATYNFTFVHNPAYTNRLGTGRNINAFGPDIFNYFYNTAHLTALATNTYDDLSNLLAGRQNGFDINKP